MELIILGLIIGLGISYLISQRFSLSKKKNLVEKQSVILLDKIKKVSKLITVEGDFSEIYHHENTKENFWGFSSKKKAIVLIQAKAHIGFDFRKIKLEADTKKKEIILSDFPQPEVVSIECDIKFYDIKNGYLNKFDSEDFTTLNKEAKEHVLSKIPESNLIQLANKEALEAILLMENLVETIGWKLDYTALETNEEIKKIAPLKK
ncbi:DUF4230 domain-containing protein [Polaribacter sp. Z014]|uniref:DUF4230 domain-containing protein n=1 Tax=unclassified Polaribacter TaxID=196858 RepID=UPI00193B6DC5|nr:MULTISPECIES: DUF4230 domain-containing protein [unclassified Polaribacter]MCL7762356.1 DUF4230 domain-containing protein [Polaribacter sp. Z014]QVY64220.1 DUF4230 domain-containing protein [Polaribacter sp. Q13]